MRPITNFISQRLLLIAVLLSLSGCILGPRYDSVIDQTATQMQFESEHFFLDLQKVVGTPNGDYDHFQAQYRNLHVYCTLLKTRAQAIPNDDITLSQLALVEQNIAIMEKLHKANKLSPGVIASEQNAMNRCYGAILKYEIAKRDFRSSSKPAQAPTK